MIHLIPFIPFMLVGAIIIAAWWPRSNKKVAVLVPARFRSQPADEGAEVWS